MHPIHPESHLIERIGWLQTAVLGAMDDITSTASLMASVAAAATLACSICAELAPCGQHGDGWLLEVLPADDCLSALQILAAVRARAG